jgi:hypothetical protein
MARTTPFTLPFGQFVSTSIVIHLRNLIPFTLLGVLFLAPWIALHVYYTQLLAEAPPQGPDDPIDMRLLLLPFASLIVNTLLSYVLTGAVTFGVVQQLRGQPAGMAQAISKGLSSFGRVFLTGLLSGFLIFLGLVCLIIPFFIVLVILYVAIPAAVMEGRGPLHSLKRSRLLTKGSRWQIFGALLLVGLVTFGLSKLAEFLIQSYRGDDVRVPLWVELAITLLLGPFSATMTAVAYFLLRQGKENVDPKAIAAVFD